jgi:hypothetical protein
MQQRKPKQQPTRQEHSLLWRMVRDQVRTIASQSDTIRRQDNLIETLLMGNRTERVKTFSKWVN